MGIENNSLNRHREWADYMLSSSYRIKRKERVGGQACGAAIGGHSNGRGRLCSPVARWLLSRLVAEGAYIISPSLVDKFKLLHVALLVPDVPAAFKRKTLLACAIR